jgi:hypothetical protein
MGWKTKPISVPCFLRRNILKRFNKTRSSFVIQTREGKSIGFLGEKTNLGRSVLKGRWWLQNVPIIPLLVL